MKSKKILFLIFMILNILIFSATDYYYNYKPKTKQIDVFDNDYKKLNNELDKITEEIDFFIGIDIKSIKKEDIYSFNSSKYFRPASTTKLFTTYLALKEFGFNKNFQTLIYLEDTPNSEVTSNIYIKGYGDPFLTVEEYKRFLNKLKLSGIKTIYGDLIFDFSYYDIKGYGEGWLWNDPQPQVLPLNLWTNNNALSKKTSYENQKDRIKYLTVYLLNDLGINFQGEIFEENVPEHLNPYFTNKSESLGSILEFMNKESDNFISEHLFRYLINNWELNNKNNYKDISELINIKLPFIPEDIVITDGTGLSTYNLVTPGIMNELILKLIDDFSLDKTKNLLTTSYENGVFFDRYKKSNLWVKTGTLYTDSAITGIIESKNKEYYVFTIFINNAVEESKIIKDLEIDIIETIYENLK
ncbi:MAG: D-alanyl-D-alanine carboxypeptidase [Thermotogota bacterium]